MIYTRWFKYDRDDLCVNKSQFVPVIFKPPCTNIIYINVTQNTVVVQKFLVFDNMCVCLRTSVVLCA